MDTFKTPKPGESLSDYVLRMRKELNLTQFEVANAAGVHSRSVGKIERGLTRKLSHKTLSGLALALSVPVEYLQAVVRGEEVVAMAAIKFCPQCWNPGGAVDSMWGNVRARFCYLCGTQLRSSCANCGELVVSLRYKFCPLCGQAYKDGGENC
ncbi:MAG: helix-turn-helix domain-containing protein [Nostocales cyanobacterium]|nr:MAG: helix-turn-helix domain-containing protein [Nostocales cyanobacterium]